MRQPMLKAVAGFILVAAFVAIVFLVVLPSNDSARKETKTKIVSSEGEAANINASAPIGFVPARSTPTPSAPVSTPEPIAYRFPTAPQLTVPQPTPDDRLATLKEALSFRTRSMNIEHPVAYQAEPAPTPAATPQAAGSRPSPTTVMRCPSTRTTTGMSRYQSRWWRAPTEGPATSCGCR